ncbi:putative oxidoreductase [Roseibaca ekhonensis]|jgi:NAD(P)-dependent dehydrogenase (short-subunit alcohol dehydrogenase family)|uniref:Putative oxidoreductase n=1 Tax=Roseinatronobacter ekhonensis TaxID=254356 RepID=A0A3B0M5U1_9RHOB|nr:SDR family oxidoreductase [Roseibaca ekhonensis]SUZ31133.1 putative oxidoreductase [Roseibaca ekhonensis]
MTNPKIVLITGASQGIGRACAVAFAQAGHKVVLVARSADKLDALAATAPDRMVARPCDVSDPEEVDALFAAIRDRFGRLDVAFNNAGLGLPATEIADISWQDWRRVASVNLDGAFLIARGAYAMMRAQDPKGGRIINNGSISAHVPRVGSVPYTATKHAITGLTRTLSLDGRKHNIACGQIDIGNAASEMTEAFTKGVPQADGSLRAEPVMDVQHVADSVLHMASLPLQANVQFMTVMATAMPYVGRG